jgi:methylenetetrahydrofolate reductase (NADPH)
MKISDKINAALGEGGVLADGKKTAYSFEYFPPRTEAGVENLLDRIDRMGLTNPFWVDVTWAAGGSTSDITLDLCASIQKYSGLDVLMHFTCTYMTREKIVDSLDKAKKHGIRNLLALRGDPPRGASDWVHQENGFNYAIDLIKFIKDTYGDFFCIGVAGYPEVHLQAKSRDEDIQHLKAKVEAGADFVITQLFFENHLYLDWVKDCKAAGINTLFIPGLMPILGYERFQRMLSFTKTKVPQKLLDTIETIKDDEEKVRAYGVEFGIEQTKDLIANGCRFIHYYTMNLETSVIKIIQGCGILDKSRELPFKCPTEESRADEAVRPIFWSLNPKKYIEMTGRWEEFPNGRWGPSRSAAFVGGEDVGGFVSYSGINDMCSPEFELKKSDSFGQEVLKYTDIGMTFCKYIDGTLKKYPFAAQPISTESQLIRETLIAMNKNKLFTVNSQPRVNGVSSTDPIFGWGPAKGFIYQKAYFEVFVPEKILEPLIEFLEKDDMISY